MKDPLLVDVKICAVRFWTWWRWNGSPKIRGFELHHVRKDLEIACALYSLKRNQRRVTK